MSWWCKKKDYKTLRNESWPFKTLWGEEKDNVITFLRVIYMDNNDTRFVASDADNVQHEASIVLDWWWRKRYDQADPCEIDKYPEEFGKWLLRQYRQKMKLNPIDNEPTPPRN